MMASPLLAELATQWIEHGLLQTLTKTLRAENAKRLLIAGQAFADLGFSAPAQGAQRLREILDQPLAFHQAMV